MKTKDWDEKYGAFVRGAVQYEKRNAERVGDKPNLVEANRDAHHCFVKLCGKRPL